MLEAVSTLKVKNESKERLWIAETEKKKAQYSGPLCSWWNNQIYFISLWRHTRIVDIHTDFLKSSMKASTCLHTERTRDKYFMKNWWKREQVTHLWEVTWSTPRRWDMEAWASTFIGAITSQKSQSSPITHWIVLLPNSYVEALTPKHFGDRPLRRWWRLMRL